jgi:vancomycin permeability regulator SanA
VGQAESVDVVMSADAGQHPAADRTPRRVWWRRVLIGLGALVVLTTVPTVWERWVATPHLRDAATVPNTPVALVFGARIVDNRPTAFLASRLDTAVDLYRRHKVTTILVSGNNNQHGYDEPGVMRDYLVAHGVPARRVEVDNAGFDTWDTCVRAREVFGVDKAILVTQAFHVARAVALCRANGVDGYGVGIGSFSVGVNSTVYGYVREYFAAGKAMWNAVVNGS